jgi:hypothetical protein
MNLKHLLPKILTTILAALVTFVVSPSENKAVLAANNQADHQSNLEGRLAKVRGMISLQRIIDEKPQTLDKSVKIGGQAIAEKTNDGGSCTGEGGANTESFNNSPSPSPCCTSTYTPSWKNWCNCSQS